MIILYFKTQKKPSKPKNEKIKPNSYTYNPSSVRFSKERNMVFPELTSTLLL